MERYFCHVVEHLRKVLPPFDYAAARIQAHHRRMQRFLESREDGARFLAMIDKAPKVWEKKLLIVDDEPILMQLLAALFSNECSVETAPDGRVGLEKIAAAYYDMVLSDIDMPEMDGIEFYKNSIARRPEQKNAFAFMTGMLNPDRERFIRSEGVRVFEKPFPINSLKTFVMEIIDR